MGENTTKEFIRVSSVKMFLNCCVLKTNQQKKPNAGQREGSRSKECLLPSMTTWLDHQIYLVEGEN